jgi:hypothetical protein
MTTKPGPKPKAGKPCMIRIRDLGPDAPWLAGEWVTRDKAVVTAYCPVWRGAVVTRKFAEISECT